MGGLHGILRPMSANGHHQNGVTLDWTMEINPMRGTIECYAGLSSGGTRVRFMPADLDALIARLVAMKELADKTAQVLAPVVKK